MLDDKLAKTPGHRDIVLPDLCLGEAVVHEWNAQTDRIDPSNMPLTKLVNVIIDHVEEARAAVVEEIVGYAHFDLLSYRAEVTESLHIRQQEMWSPVLEWAEKRLKIVLPSVVGVMAAPVSQESLKQIRHYLESFDTFALGAVADLTHLTGSCILPLALWARHLSADQVWDVAHVDEDWQVEFWGQDSEAAVRREQNRRAFDKASFLLACRTAR